MASWRPTVIAVAKLFLLAVLPLSFAGWMAERITGWDFHFLVGWFCALAWLHFDRKPEAA